MMSIKWWCPMRCSKHPVGRRRKKKQAREVDARNPARRLARTERLLHTENRRQLRGKNTLCRTQEQNSSYLASVQHVQLTSFITADNVTAPDRTGGNHHSSSKDLIATTHASPSSSFPLSHSFPLEPKPIATGPVQSLVPPS